jgi:hypothetical protein
MAGSQRRMPASLAGARSWWLWCLATALSAWWLTFTPMRNTDFWWHLASGRWIVEHHAVALVDPFSFTAHGMEWLNNEWLGDVVFYLWSAAGGLPSLVYWFWGVLLVTYLLLFQLCRELGGSPVAGFFGVSLAVATSAPYFEFRPHLYSLLLFVVLLRMILLRRAFWHGLPLIFLVWSNLHPSFVFGLLVLATALLVRIVTTASLQRLSGGHLLGAIAGHRADLLIAGGCALACLVNPFGLRAYLFPLKYFFDRSSPWRTLTEWLSPFSREGVSPPLFPWLVAIFLLACLLLASSGSRRLAEPETRWTIVALGGLTLVMALSSSRFIPLFSISACLPISLLWRPGAAAAAAGGKAMEERLPRRALRASLPLLLAAGCLAMLARYPLGSRAFAHLASLETYPVDTLDFIETNRIAGRVFAYYGWGSYVQYRTRGRMQVYIDARAGNLYSPALYNDYRRVQYLLPGWTDVVESSDADYFLWLNMETPQVSQIRQPDILVATGRWRKLHEDFVSVLLARTRIALPQALKEEPRSAYRELALGGLAMRSGDRNGAEMHLRSALSLGPNMLVACRNLARVLAWQGRVREAWSRHDDCQRIFPESDGEDDLRNIIAGRL